MKPASARAALATVIAVTVLAGCAPSSGTVTDHAYTPAWTEHTKDCTTRTTRPTRHTRPGDGRPITVTERCSPVRVEHPARYRLFLDNGHDSGWRTVPADEYRRCPPPNSHYPGCTLTGGPR